MSDSSSQTDTYILRTKLYRPEIRGKLVMRSHLLQRLTSDLPRSLTFVFAPPGYGKSTLVSMWLTMSDTSSGWISLDEHDNDIITFTNYLLSAISNSTGLEGFHTRSYLKGASKPILPILVRHLIQDLDQISQRYIIVLDDIQLLHDTDIIKLLRQLIKHQPKNLHLVLIGRHEPQLLLASIRTSHKFVEITSSDLRFNVDETTNLLAQHFDQKISETIAHQWVKDTGGWVAALHLGIIANKQHATTIDDSTPIFKDTHQNLQDYLLVEVLDNLTAEHLDWLLKCSVLDRFCASLCEAVCRSSDYDHLFGSDFIHWLKVNNLFWVSLDNDNQWYRLHHLFQSQLNKILKQQYDAKHIEILQIKASEWFFQNNWIEEAIRYALLAGRTDIATEWFMQSRYNAMNVEDWQRIEGWLKLFPQDIIDQSVILTVTSGHLAIYKGRATNISAISSRAKNLLEVSNQDGHTKNILQAELKILDSIKHILLGNAQDLISYCQSALETLPPKAHYLRTNTIFGLLIGHQFSGNVQLGIDITKEYIKGLHNQPLSYARSYFFISLAALLEGDLDMVHYVASQGLIKAEKSKATGATGQIIYCIGVVHYLRNQLSDAEFYLNKIIENAHWIATSYLVQGTCALAKIYVTNNHLGKAQKLLGEVKDYLEESNELFAVEFLRAFEVELALDRGDIALALSRASLVNFNQRPPLWFHYVPQFTQAKLKIAENTQQSLEEALSQLDELEKMLRSVNRKFALIDVLALKALVYAGSNITQSLSLLEESLHMAEKGRFIRNFIDLGSPMETLLLQFQKNINEQSNLAPYIMQLLQAFSDKNQLLKHHETAFDALTSRETEMLNWLTTNLTPQEIAQSCNISVATVRTHIRNIYVKLNVNSRFEAVQLAKKLNIF